MSYFHAGLVNHIFRYVLFTVISSLGVKFLTTPLVNYWILYAISYNMTTH